MGDSGTVQAMLLQEAQQEIASLRTDLYNTRRVSEERRAALAALGAARDQLSGQVQALETSLAQAHAQLAALQGVEAQLAALQETAQQLQRELHASVSARRILADELSDERKLRAAAEAAKGKLESERSRIQKSRDDLAAQVRLAQNAAREAEEEQLHAEAEVQALQGELAALRSGSMAPAPADGGHGHAAAAAAALEQQLEHERNRSALLMESLHAARAELDSLAAAQGAAPGAEEEAEALRAEADAMRRNAAEAHAHAQRLQQQLEAAMAELAAARQLPPHPDTHSPPQPVAPAVGGPPQQRLLSREHPAPSSSDSLWALTAPGQLGEEALPGEGTGREAELCVQLGRYQAQVAKLKHSRDKLLEEIDSQWEEMDRMAGEHRAAIEEAAVQRRLADSWEGQAQEALGQVERLKELMEESATWGGEGAGKLDAVRKLQGQVVQEQARAVEMELGARALAAEVLRAQAASVAIGRSVLPVLCGIEHRLGGMRGRAEGALRQWRQQRQQGGMAMAAAGAGAGAALEADRAAAPSS